ncbi:hypothetical protein GCM10010357_34370 [Streptomyces luteireticuli]|uniref:Uncharacterized protein n=1 Tax=Streptomyces luteireticuli TaxID=173858 RepID=A0ABN0YU90_9ACTN
MHFVVVGYRAASQPRATAQLRDYISGQRVLAEVLLSDTMHKDNLGHTPLPKCPTSLSATVGGRYRQGARSQEPRNEAAPSRIEADKGTA